VCIHVYVLGSLPGVITCEFGRFDCCSRMCVRSLAVGCADKLMVDLLSLHRLREEEEGDG